MAEFPKERITGTENEWSLVEPMSDGASRPLNSEQVKRILKECLPEGIISTDKGMLSNGGRVYVDLSTFLEYATAEDRSFTGTVTNELASEQIIRSMLSSAIEKNIAPETTRLHKRVISDSGTTWGYHTSFSTDAKNFDITDPHDSQVLGMHLATMNIYAGAGMLRNDKTGTPYYTIGQKVLNLNANGGVTTHNPTQPLISLKNEALSNKEKFGRAHITSMDANISPWATWMKLGTTSIVLRLIESGYREDAAQDIMLEDNEMMYKLATDVAMDPTVKKVSAPMKDGTLKTAIDIQRTLLAHSQHLSLPTQEQEVWHEWSRALDVLEGNPDNLVEADWVMRRRLINNKIGKAGLDITSSLARYWNDQYDLISADTNNIPTFLRTKGVFRRFMPDQATILERITTPPQDTRAALRGELITKFHKMYNFSVDWETQQHQVTTGYREYTYMNDPYSTIPTSQERVSTAS